jgi:hypothetical protein
MSIVNPLSTARLEADARGLYRLCVAAAPSLPNVDQRMALDPSRRAAAAGKPASSHS